MYIALAGNNNHMVLCISVHYRRKQRVQRQITMMLACMDCTSCMIITGNGQDEYTICIKASVNYMISDIDLTLSMLSCSVSLYNMHKSILSCAYYAMTIMLILLGTVTPAYCLLFHGQTVDKATLSPLTPACPRSPPPKPLPPHPLPLSAPLKHILKASGSLFFRSKMHTNCLVTDF